MAKRKDRIRAVQRAVEGAMRRGPKFESSVVESISESGLLEAKVAGRPNARSGVPQIYEDATEGVPQLILTKGRGDFPTSIGDFPWSV